MNSLTHSALRLSRSSSPSQPVQWDLPGNRGPLVWPVPKDLQERTEKPGPRETQAQPAPQVLPIPPLLAG